MCFYPISVQNLAIAQKAARQNAWKAAFISEPLFQLAYAPSFDRRPHERVAVLAAVWKSAGLSAELLLAFDAAGQAELTLQHSGGTHRFICF